MLQIPSHTGRCKCFLLASDFSNLFLTRTVPRSHLLQSVCKISLANLWAKIWVFTAIYIYSISTLLLTKSMLKRPARPTFRQNATEGSIDIKLINNIAIPQAVSSLELHLLILWLFLKSLNTVNKRAPGKKPCAAGHARALHLLWMWHLELKWVPSRMKSAVSEALQCALRRISPALSEQLSI